MGFCQISKNIHGVIEYPGVVAKASILDLHFKFWILLISTKKFFIHHSHRKSYSSLNLSDAKMVYIYGVILNPKFKPTF